MAGVTGNALPKWLQLGVFRRAVVHPNSLSDNMFRDSIAAAHGLLWRGTPRSGVRFRDDPERMIQSFRILLVEDDDSLRVCLSEFLASHGWVVAATGHGDEAMDLAQQTRFDFSILDFHLPGITGLELFRQLVAVQPLPSILMSGLASTEETVAARNAGFFRFLRKPVELHALRQAVQQLIGTHFGGPLTNLPPGHPAAGPARRPTGSANRPTRPRTASPTHPTHPAAPHSRSHNRPRPNQ